MSRWLRFYADTMRNPKVMRLSDADYRLWTKLLCVAAENEGSIPPASDLKLILGARLDHLQGGLKRLISGGLIDLLGDGYTPHNWDKFQYKSDTSNERVARHRAKRNVTVTPPDTEADTEKKEPIADAMDGKPSQDANPAVDPIDLKALLFSTGKPYLIRNGVSPANAGAIIGKWRQSYGDGAVIDALALAEAEACSAPIPFITKILENRNGRNGPRPVGGAGPEGQSRPGTVAWNAGLNLIERAVAAQQARDQRADSAVDRGVEHPVLRLASR
jgi:hypothetical protein